MTFSNELGSSVVTRSGVAPTDGSGQELPDNLTATSNNTAATSSPLPLQEHRPSTRFQHGIRKPKAYTDGTVRYSCLTSTG